MDFRDLKYKIEANKTKILFIVGVVGFILALIVGFFSFFNINLGYKKTHEEVDSRKYILAEGILGANVNGVVNLYNPAGGKKLDSKQLEGETFIYDKSSNLKSLVAYNVENSTLHEIESKNKKIIISDAKKVNLKNKNILNFDYEDKHFVGLLDDKKSFVYKNLSRKKEEKIDLKLDSDIDSYLVVKDNLIFTSEDYIYTVNLKNAKHKKIEIGESSLSIHKLKNKVYIHNAFGYERNKSILLDINPQTLYINSVYQFRDSNVHVIETSSDSEIVYFNEESLVSKENKVSQVLKTLGVNEKRADSRMEYVGEYSMNRLNSYGNLGYIYYQEGNRLKIFNLKNSDEEYNFKFDDDIYMPIY